MTEPCVAEGVHEYLATACQHGLHESCRFFCKFCPARCSCPCHAGADVPYPGYSPDEEQRLRAGLRDAIRAAEVEPVPERAEVLVDIVTSVLHRLAKEKAGAHGDGSGSA